MYKMPFILEASQGTCPFIPNIFFYHSQVDGTLLVLSPDSSGIQEQESLDEAISLTQTHIQVLFN